MPPIYERVVPPTLRCSIHLGFNGCETVEIALSNENVPFGQKCLS
jgi:hypothetical protein